MATNHIDGDLVGIWISTVLTSPQASDWDEIVCGMNVGLSGSGDVTTKRTRCGVIRTQGPFGWEITATGTHNTAPTAGAQVSADDLLTHAQSGTQLLVKVAHATDTSLLYRVGQATISSYDESINVGDSAEYDITFSVTGDLDITP